MNNYSSEEEKVKPEEEKVKPEEEKVKPEEEKVKPEEEKIKQDQTLIFDWDDTILPSSFFIKKDIHLHSEIDDELTLKLKEYDKLIYPYFKDKTIIILTNAEHSWVYYTSIKFLPLLSSLIYHSESTIKVLSAREYKSKEIPEHMIDSQFYWKRDTLYNYFYHKNQNFTDHHLISIGDSDYERRAVKDIANIYCAWNNSAKITNKIIKTKDKPSLEELSKQMVFIFSILPFIENYQGNLDLYLS